jgi:outer membrane protein assembly factor BamA
VNGEVAFPAFNEKLKPASFTKFDFDFTYHKVVNKYNNIVWRLNSGIGIPYGSSRALPFEKSFFAGGANSIRAWTARTLGPGSYLKSVNIEESGDIKIETNLEYRSEFLRLSSGIIWEAAAFLDVGNIWTRNADVSRPGGQFSKDALKELAVGGGVGLRFNFSFFILRFDAATKLRDPSLDPKDRWVYPGQKFGLVDIYYNLAIGYPF